MTAPLDVLRVFGFRAEKRAGGWIRLTLESGMTAHEVGEKLWAAEAWIEFRAKDKPAFRGKVPADVVRFLKDPANKAVRDEVVAAAQTNHAPRLIGLACTLCDKNLLPEGMEGAWQPAKWCHNGHSVSPHYYARWHPNYGQAFDYFPDPGKDEANER